MRLRHDTFWLLILISVGVVGCRSNPGTSTAVPATVTVAKPATQSVTEYLNFTGNTAASDSVTLVARVEGYFGKSPLYGRLPGQERRPPIHDSAGSIQGAASAGECASRRAAGSAGARERRAGSLYGLV